MFEGKKILITGGTGSIGKALTRRLLQYEPESIRIFSRNEYNQTVMTREFKSKYLRFFIGDIRDYGRLVKAMEDVDVVFHTAALKDAIAMEYNPFESVKTNVIGTQNVIDACHAAKVKLAVSISTDKAVSPLNVYGATKLLMEKLTISARNYVDIKKHLTKFAVVRYGNVLGSSGSVVPKFIEQIKTKQPIMITDPRMSRFNITIDEALNFILYSAKMSKSVATFVPKLRAYNIIDLKDALFEILGKTECKIAKIRPGEKLAEVLINEDEATYALENDDGFIIAKNNTAYNDFQKMYADHKRVVLGSRYSSDTVEKISKKELISMLETFMKNNQSQ